MALVVTEGYKDILQTRRSQVPGGLASWIIWPKPEPLTPLELTVEAPGRLSSDGSVVREFDEKTFKDRLQLLVKHKPDAITISLIIHSQTQATSKRYKGLSKNFYLRYPFPSLRKSYPNSWSTSERLRQW